MRGEEARYNPGILLCWSERKEGLIETAILGWNGHVMNMRARGSFPRAEYSGWNVSQVEIMSSITLHLSSLDGTLAVFRFKKRDLCSCPSGQSNNQSLPLAVRKACHVCGSTVLYF